MPYVTKHHAKEQQKGYCQETGRLYLFIARRTIEGSQPLKRSDQSRIVKENGNREDSGADFFYFFWNNLLYKCII